MRRSVSPRHSFNPSIWLSVLAAALLSGCSGAAIKTYPVAGKVQITDGDTSQLAGSHVELLHETDQALRPSGKIAPSGDFKLETLCQGRILPGAPEGTYKARIILADESDEGIPKRKGEAIHRRFFDFQTSGLSLKVPGGDYNFSLSRK
jgi:hypothetical protein